MNLDKEYWENRYREQQTGWDAGSITTPLKEYFDQLENKELEILIPGGGSGHEASYLHKQGFTNVHLLDVAEQPLKNFKKNHPDFPDEHLHQEDFFEHSGQYDLIVEQTFFCALNPVMREDYVKKMKTLLKPGGKLVGVLFNCEMNEGPPFGGSAGEYAALFKKHFREVSIEPCYNSIPPRAGNEVFIRITA